MESFGSNIRKLRIDRGLPLRTVAAYLKIDQAILSKIERGQRKAPRAMVVRLSKYFKVKENDLMVTWLSDKLAYELEDETVALKALQMAEEKVLYKVHDKIDRKRIIKKIQKYFNSNEMVTRAWLFGSFARGQDDHKSDIDIMIEVPSDSKFSLFDLADVQYQLELMISLKVDIVMSDGVRPQVRERMEPDLQLVYER